MLIAEKILDILKLYASNGVLHVSNDLKYVESLYLTQMVQEVHYNISGDDNQVEEVVFRRSRRDTPLI